MVEQIALRNNLYKSQESYFELIKRSQLQSYEHTCSKPLDQSDSIYVQREMMETWFQLHLWHIFWVKWFRMSFSRLLLLKWALLKGYQLFTRVIVRYCADLWRKLSHALPYFYCLHEKTFCEKMIIVTITIVNCQREYLLEKGCLYSHVFIMMPCNCSMSCKTLKFIFFNILWLWWRELHFAHSKFGSEHTD